MVSCMVDLAGIVAMISQNAGQPDNMYGAEEMSQRSANLETSLLQWKSRLPHQLDFEASSLEESELITKQKIVLKLRRLKRRDAVPLLIGSVGFLNANILLHRPFLMMRAGLSQATVSRHVVSCIEAARETIAFMHTTYLHRPYFRTW